MKINNDLKQIPVGTKVKLKKPYFDYTEGVIVAVERIICNKPHRIMHTVLFNGEDQYDYRTNPIIKCFKYDRLIAVE